MRKRTRMGLGLAAFLGLCLSGIQCGVQQPTGTGVLELLITDKPFPFEFIEEAWITITSVEVRRSGGVEEPDDAGCAGDADCDDGRPCNGAETCDLETGGCEAGDSLVCDAPDLCDDLRGGCAAPCAEDLPCCASSAAESMWLRAVASPLGDRLADTEASRAIGVVAALEA